jgi:multidrug efflux pump subunit AcrA (membrane-fusion protein)
MGKKIIYAVLLSFAAMSCGPGTRSPEAKQAAGGVPVTITHASIDTLKETVALNAVSSYLLKTYIKSNVNGYLQEVNARLGEKVLKGQRMFVIRTKEAEYLGNTINALDTTLKFTGKINIYSSGNGYVSQLSYRSGDYVQDGETLAAISDESSQVFLLELPYEMRQYLSNNRTVSLDLPDGSRITGNVAQAMPAVDPVSQTQSFIIRIPAGLSIPENLIARVNFVKFSKPGAVTLPKEAVLSNEVQDEFWIMKMIDNTTAVKVPVTKGMVNGEKVEILSPELNPTDRILLTGNYGLPDTAQVVTENGSK